MITIAQQEVLDKLTQGWQLYADPYYGGSVWLEKGIGGWQDPYRTMHVRRSTFNALLNKRLIKYNFIDKVYQAA